MSHKAKKKSCRTIVTSIALRKSIYVCHKIACATHNAQNVKCNKRNTHHKKIKIICVSFSESKWKIIKHVNDFECEAEYKNKIEIASEWARVRVCVFVPKKMGQILWTWVNIQQHILLRVHFYLWNMWFEANCMLLRVYKIQKERTETIYSTLCTLYEWIEGKTAIDTCLHFFFSLTFSVYRDACKIKPRREINEYWQLLCYHPWYWCE